MDETSDANRFIHKKGTKLDQTFEQQVLELLPRLRRFAIGLAGSPADGDDLCQMTIERALTRREQWQEGTRLDSWMYRIMRNILIDEKRAGTRRSETFVAEEAGASVGSQGAQEPTVELSMIDRMMAKLPDDQREAVLLVMVEGYSYKEAAEIVGCPVGTLNSRLVRGRDALMALLDPGTEPRLGGA
jgi:RNA polymerase sigma-70 factor (ECF subfamily)